MGCHAQNIATSELNGTKWKLVSPVSDYCERGMSFTMTTRTTTTKFKKKQGGVSIFFKVLSLFFYS